MICFVIFIDDYKNATENMGVSYIASYVRKRGYSCQILIIEKRDILKLYSMINIEEVKLLVFSFYCDTVSAVLQCAEMVKRDYKNILVLIGGHNAKNYEEKILHDNNFIDMVTSCDGEEVVADIASYIFKGEPAIGQIKGIYYRENKQIKKNEERNVIMKLDTLPFPARDIHEKYAQEFLYITGSRGCSGNCTFCYETINKIGRPIRCRSAKNIIDEMKFLSEKYKIHNFEFTDSTFEDNDIINYTRSTEIFSLLIEQSLNFNISVFSRAEVVAKAPKGYYELAKKAGLESIFLGIEAGNNLDLKVYGKKAKLEDNIAAIERLKRNNISAVFGFINFNPYSTYDTLKQNAEFLKNSGLGHNIRLYLTKLEVFPQSAIRKRLIRDGLMSGKSDYKTNIYDYTYQNRNVEKLAKVLSLEKIDSRQYGIDNMITLNENRIVNKYPQFYDNFKNIFDEVKEIRIEKNILLFNMFNDCLDKAFNGASLESLENIFMNSNFNKYDEIMRKNHLKLLVALKRNRVK